MSSRNPRSQGRARNGARSTSTRSRGRRSWIVPAVLGGVVTFLVLSTRRSSLAATTPAITPGTTPGTTTPGGGHVRTAEEKAAAAARTKVNLLANYHVLTTQDPKTIDPNFDFEELEAMLRAYQLSTQADDIKRLALRVRHPSEPSTPGEVLLEPGSIMAVYNSLMTAMQTDIRSVDPALLERLASKLAGPGLRHFEQAAFAKAYAACAKDARAEPDPDFFPVSCALGRAPNQAPTTPAITQAMSALLTRYAEAMSKSLYVRDGDIPSVPADVRASLFLRVVDLDTLISDLTMAGRADEVTNLRARRDQLYQLKYENSVKRVRTADRGSLFHEASFADELEHAGYPSNAISLRGHIGNRQRELGP